LLSVARAPVFSTTSRPALGPKQHLVQLVAHFPREQSGRNVTLSCHLRLRMTAAILLCRYVHGMDRDGCTATGLQWARQRCSSVLKGCIVMVWCTRCCQMASHRKTKDGCFVMCLVSLRSSQFRFAVLCVCPQDATLHSRASEGRVTLF